MDQTPHNQSMPGHVTKVGDVVKALIKMRPDDKIKIVTHASGNFEIESINVCRDELGYRVAIQTGRRL